MADELPTRACQACGWPALAGTRRCPYCREPFPRPRRVRAVRSADMVRWLAIGWIVAVIPPALVAYAVVGALPAVAVFLVSLTPALTVAFLYQRTALRIERLGGRGRGGRVRALDPHNSPTESSNPSSDASRR